MIREMIASLTFMYRYAALGRGKLDADALAGIKMGADAVAQNAESVLAKSESEHGVPEREIREGLQQAQLVDQHIDEMVNWLISLEIV